MNINNEKIFARTEEKECNAYPDPRGGKSFGRESKINRLQQERDDREDRSWSDFSGFGRTITGGMLRQLIKEYKDQLATKKDTIERLTSEVQQLEAKIEEFESLEKQLGVKEVDS